MAVKYVVRKEGEQWTVARRANWFRRYFGIRQWEPSGIYPQEFKSWADAFEEAFWWCHHQREGWGYVPPMHHGEFYVRSDYSLP